MKQQRLLWQKILWSVVIIFSICLYFKVISNNSSNMFGVFPYYFVGVWASIMLGYLTIILRYFGFIQNKQSFGYILIGIFSLSMFLIGIYMMYDSSRFDIAWFSLFVAPVIPALIILIDAIRNKPGYT